MKALHLLGVSFAVGLGLAPLPACSMIVGITDLPTTNVVTLPGDGGAVDASRFLGTWTITTGSNTVTCGGTPSTANDSGSMVVSRGTDTDLVTTAGGGCSLRANITSADTATLLPNQSCTGTAPDGTGVITFSLSGTFTIDSAATTGTVSLAGTATDVDRGTSTTCTFEQSDQYAKN